MEFRVEYDLGTLCVEFAGLRIWFCDNQSNECFERFEKRFQSVYGEGFKIEYLKFDSQKCDVTIYREFDDCMAFLAVSYHAFFQYSPSCSLLKFINMFSRKKLVYDGLRPRMVANRYFVRS